MKKICSNVIKVKIIDILVLECGYLNFSCSFHSQLWRGLKKISVDVPDLQSSGPESRGYELRDRVQLIINVCFFSTVGEWLGLIFQGLQLDWCDLTISDPDTLNLCDLEVRRQNFIITLHDFNSSARHFLFC